MVAASCGGDDGSTAEPGGSSDAATTEDDAPVDPDGVLRIGVDLEQAGPPTFDPSTPWTPSPATNVQIFLYDSLLRPAPDGSLGPGLAKSAEIVDPQTITLELQPDITFTDGTPLDAEAVKFNIERNRDAQDPTLSAELQEIESVSVDGPLEATIHLKSPIAGALYELLPYGDFLIASPTAIRDGVDLNETPVGAGPFMLESTSPGRSMTYVKNPDYFQADQIRLAGIEWIHTEAGQATTNAFLSGAIDVADAAIAYPQIAELEGAPHIATNVETTDNVLLWGQLCKSRPPFDDVRVRQALNYGIDRDALNELMYDGQGEPQWGFFASDSPLHNDEVDGFYEYDPERARELLAEAGQEELTFNVVFTEGTESQRAAEIVQQQWAEIGVTIELVPLTNPGEFFPDAEPGPLNIFPLMRSGIQKVARNLVPPSIGNVCNWDDPELNDLVAQINAVPQDSPEAVDLWAELQELTLSEAMNIFGLFGVHATAWNDDRIGDIEFVPNFQGRPVINGLAVYIKG